MCDASAGNCEFTEVVANHFWLNLDWDKGLSAVDGDGLPKQIQEELACHVGGFGPWSRLIGVHGLGNARSQLRTHEPWSDVLEQARG